MQQSVINEKLEEWAPNIIVPDDSLVVVNHNVFDSHGNLCGSGFVRTVGEVTIILDPKLSKLDKMNVIRELFALGKIDSLQLGIDKWVAFAKDEMFVKLLKKRFGFDNDSGLGLSLRL
jgi:hypothetical protein